MGGLQIFMKFVAVVLFVIAAIHFFMGPNADVLLGSTLSGTALVDPVNDSQNRIYGTLVAIYGVLLWMTANDYTRYREIFKIGLIVFFVGGLARIFSIFMVGPPSIWILGLLAIELLVPPLLWIWAQSLHKEAS